MHNIWKKKSIKKNPCKWTQQLLLKHILLKPSLEFAAQENDSHVFFFFPHVDEKEIYNSTQLHKTTC